MNMPLVLLNRRRRGFTAFSPSSLYSSGAQGIWLDPSDLTTMFSDRAGTTPVTTPGTVVGLRLDKSKALALGSELVVNGTFDTNLTGWSVTNVVWSSGTASFTGIPSLSQSMATSSGVTYRVTITVSGLTGGSMWLRFTGGTAANSPTFSNGVNTFVLRSNGNTSLLIEQATGTITAGTIDNISVRELPGNHAVAPTDAARPIYGVEPKGGRRNLLTWSESLPNAAWVKAVTVASGVLDPDGGSTAFTLTSPIANAEAYQEFTGRTVGQANTFQCWMRRRTGSGAIQIYANSTRTTVTLTSSWQLITLTENASAATIYFGFRVAVSGDAIDVWHPQFELGSTATAYQRVTTAYDVTESGAATCHYVQYDGSDDSMSTSAIDFTGTDKMSVFAGVRKLSDANVALLAEIGTSGSINGQFTIAAPVGAGQPNYYFNSRGTSDQPVTATGYPAPNSALLAGLFDISGDRVTARINGIQVGQNTSDQGTGNFGNYPLFIGRRNNATLPFNGKDYGIVIVGKAASAGEITDTETWLAAKTSGVTL